VSSGREGRQCLERRRYLGLYGEVHLQAVETKLGGDGPRPTGASAAARRGQLCRLRCRWAPYWNEKSARQGGRLHALLAGSSNKLAQVVLER
jgi:hypothetical protein